MTRTVLGLFAAAALSGMPTMTEAQPQAAEPSMEAEFGYLIGAWTCRVSLPYEAASANQRPPEQTVSFEWLYDGAVLKQTLSAPAYSGEFVIKPGQPQTLKIPAGGGEFFTTLDRRTRSFKGVGIMSNGTYVVWEGHGLVGRKSIETGYVFSDGQLVAVSRSEFERTGDAHFVIRNWDGPGDDGPGALNSIQDCSRRSG